MKKFNVDDKFKNAYFWVSVLAVVFSASGVAFEELTSWKLLGEAILGILQNPVSILSIILAWIGIFNDNSTKGLDKIVVKKREE